MHQDEFNFYVVAVLIVAGILWLFHGGQLRQSIRKGGVWGCLREPQKAQEDSAASASVAVPFASDAEDIRKASQRRKGPGAAKRPAGQRRRCPPSPNGGAKGGRAVAAALSSADAIRELLEALSSGSSNPPSDLDPPSQEDDLLLSSDPDPKGARWNEVVGDRRHGSGSVDKVMMHDVRPDKAPEGAIAALAELTLKELLGVSVWDVVFRRRAKLRVMGCFRTAGEGRYQALGLAVLRMQQQQVQILYLGVAAPERRSGVGRSLVRAIREIARREPLCLSIVALAPTASPQDAQDGPLHMTAPEAFWKATGFKRADVKGLEEGEACYKIDVRKLGKKQRRQMERSGGLGLGHTSLLSWPELLWEVRRGAAGPDLATVHLPRPPPRPAAAKEVGKRRNAQTGSDPPGSTDQRAGGPHEILRASEEELDDGEEEEEEEEEQDQGAEENTWNEDAEEEEGPRSEPSRPPGRWRGPRTLAVQQWHQRPQPMAGGGQGLGVGRLAGPVVLMPAKNTEKGEQQGADEYDEREGEEEEEEHEDEEEHEGEEEEEEEEDAEDKGAVATRMPPVGASAGAGAAAGLGTRPSPAAPTEASTEAGDGAEEDDEEDFLPPVPPPKPAARPQARGWQPTLRHVQPLELRRPAAGLTRRPAVAGSRPGSV